MERLWAQPHGRGLIVGHYFIAILQGRFGERLSTHFAIIHMPESVRCTG